MNKVDQLDLSLFDHIISQTTIGCRRSLLAVQRATARRFGNYTYLEIGSYLGGSLQPHVIDERCSRIYSIDLRPAETPDNAYDGRIVTYYATSEQKMLDNLGNIEGAEISKIVCFQCNASDVDNAQFNSPPHIAFLDGEHTNPATMNDFNKCLEVIHPSGAILFHDYGLIHRAVGNAMSQLRSESRSFTPIKLEGSVFGIFFDRETVDDDLFLSGMARTYWANLFRFNMKKRLSKVLPRPAIRALARIFPRRQL